MSSEKKTFRVPEDAYSALQEMNEETGINEHKCGIRALERGLSELGYGGGWSAEVDDEHWLAGVLVDAAKVLLFAGLGFAFASGIEAAVAVWIGITCVGTAALALLAERHAQSFARALGLPDKPPGAGGEDA